jgi:hypothetical protein
MRATTEIKSRQQFQHVQPNLAEHAVFDLIVYK